MPIAVSRWLASQLAPPPSVPPGEARHHRTLIVITWCFLGGHALLGALLAAMGQPWLGLVYLGSIGVNLVALALARRGRWRLANELNLVEFLLNITVMSYLLGLESGYVLYYGAFPLASFLVVAGDRRRLVLFTALGYGVGAVVLASVGAPVIALPAWGLRALWILNIVGFCNGIVAFGVFGSLIINRSEKQLADEKARSEQLLLNVLPGEIAARLQGEDRTIADDFDSVSVLFADLVGFTALSARMPSRDIVAMLNDLFSAFDELTDRHGLEKIKTIGDAYMVVGGAPRPHADHATAVASLALDMLDAVKAYAARAGQTLDVRVGIHSGPVVAGVIGVKKFAYDLWGDTVNTASRMESHGTPGRIQLTSATAALLAGRFPLVERGLVEVKGIGAMTTFFLDERPTKQP